MRKMIVILACVLCGCVAKGPTFDNIKLEKGRVAKLVIYRPSSMAFGGYYEVDVNGETRCKLLNGSFFIVDELEGKTVVSSSIWNQPGTSRIAINAKPKQIYYLRMEMNDGKQVAGALGGLGGYFIAEGVSTTSGPFVFTLKDENEAKSELATLRQDCL